MKSIAIVCVLACVVGCSKKNPEPAPAASASTAAKPVTSASAAATVATAAAGPFEGEIDVTVKDEASQKLPATITYRIKGAKVRYEPAAAPVKAIEDGTAHHAYVIDDTKKSYEDLDTTAKSAPPSVTKTGKTEKIAGLDCEHWTLDDSASQEKVDACVAKNVAWFDLAQAPKPGAAEPGWAAALTKENAFPLRLVVSDAKGKERYRVDATKVNKAKQDDTLFQAPAAYKKTDLGKEVSVAALP